MRKTRLNELTPQELTQLSNADISKMPQVQRDELSAMKPIIRTVLRDKKYGMTLAFLINLLPDLKIDKDHLKTTILVNAVILMQYFNRTLDFAAFIQTFTGKGAPQAGFAYPFAFLAASQLATQMSALSVGAAIALQEDGRDLYAKATHCFFNKKAQQPEQTNSAKSAV